MTHFFLAPFTLVLALNLSHITTARAQNRTIIVNTVVDEMGTNPSATSLREAIMEANRSTTLLTIRFDTTVFNGESANTIMLTNGQLMINRSVTIDASNLSAHVTIDGNQQTRILEVRSGISTIQGLTFTGGNVEDRPSTDNFGGAISLNNFASLTLNDCFFSENSAFIGGAISSVGDSSLSLNRCSFSGNSAGFGGAISNARNASLSLNNCSLSSNLAWSEGGGIHNRSGFFNLTSLSLENCSLSQNFSRTGGGIFSEGNSNISLLNCTLFSNSSNIDGGGILNSVEEGETSTLSLTHCTLVGNAAGVSPSAGENNAGGGVAVVGPVSLSLRNCILAANTAAIAPDLVELVPSSLNLPFGSLGPTTTLSGNNLLSSTEGNALRDTSLELTLIDASDLNLAPLGDYGGPTMTMPPQLNSPAINRGDRSNLGGTDQRGFPRLVGTALDLGAVEFQGQDQETRLTFMLDSDSDGMTNGVELAIGTDPLLQDADHERNLRIARISGNSPQLTFGLNPAQEDTIILRLTRSTDLSNFTEVTSNENNDFPDLGTGLLMIADPNPPAEGKAFYRLEAVQRP